MIKELKQVQVSMFGNDNVDMHYPFQGEQNLL